MSQNSSKSRDTKSASPIYSDTNNCVEDWQLWCRLCAKDDIQGNISVFFKDEHLTGTKNCVWSNESNLANAIDKYFSVHIERNDLLPQMLCTECLSLVTLLVNFSERMQKAQFMFEELNKMTVKNKNEEENNKVDANVLRLKYGLLDNERDHVIVQQHLPEVHYLEEKSNLQINDVAPNKSNKLDQQQQMFIKKEQIFDEDHCMETENVVNFGDLEDDPFEDKVGDISDGLQENERYLTNKHAEFPIKSSMSKIKTEISKRRLKTKTKKPSTRKSKLKAVKLEKQEKSDIILSNSDNDNADADENDKDFDINNHEDNGGEEENNDNKRIHACKECPRKFIYHHNLRHHVKHVHGNDIPSQTFPCTICDKTYTANCLLRQHIKHAHIKERHFICEECGIGVVSNSALKQHMLKHTDYAPHICEICKKGFKCPKSLRNHLEIHDPRKHTCPKCGLQLNSRATLNRHLVVHSDVMQHKCDYCGRAFKRVKALKNHLILHTGLKPYSCDFCDRTFANGSNCRSHKKKAHPDLLAALEASGGGQKYTKNIPKLEALKAVTKAADNLAPVVSKQSGCFAFGKKPKPTTEKANEKSDKNDKLAAIKTENITSDLSVENSTTDYTSMNMDLQTTESNDVAVASSANGNSINATGIPTIDNLYLYAQCLQFTAN